MMSIIKWFKGPSTTGDQYVEVSEANPLPVSSVGGGGWQGVGEILQGTVAQGEEKLIDLSAEGVTAIWIQASPANTEPLQVGNVSGFEGAWVAPGSSEWFYFSKLYIKHGATASQGMAYQAVKYG